MAVQPIVSWYWETNQDTDQVTRWDIGYVNASEVSPDFTFLIWNNRKGVVDVPDMQNAVITVKDELGGNTGELVEGQWIEVKVDQIDLDFFPIGWDAITNTEVSRPIKTLGSTTNSNGTFTPNVPPHDTPNGEVSILGVANDGTLQNSAGNVVKATMRCRVPGNAASGVINFRTRVRFQYV